MAMPGPSTLLLMMESPIFTEQIDSSRKSCRSTGKPILKIEYRPL